MNSFTDGSAFCPGAPKRVPSDSEKHRRVYTSSNVCHSHEWRVDTASGKTLRKRNACLHAVRQAVEKKLRVYGLRSEGVNKTTIKQVNSIKFLGVIIDENITWKIHCDKVHTRVLGILCKLKYILPEKTLFSIYNTLSLPHLQYEILAWGNIYQTYLNKLLHVIVQKKTLRVINNTSYRAHAAPLFIKNNTLTVFDLYQYHLGVLMYKFDKKALPTPLSTFFTRNVDIHQYNTRSANKLHVNKVSLQRLHG